MNAVVALDQDRLVREPFELELLLRLCEDVGVKHVTTSEGEITDEGVMTDRIRVGIAAQEIKKMKEPHRRRQEDIARAGKWGGATARSGTARTISRSRRTIRCAAARRRAPDRRVWPRVRWCCRWDDGPCNMHPLPARFEEGGLPGMRKFRVTTDPRVHDDSRGDASID